MNFSRFVSLIFLSISLLYCEEWIHFTTDDGLPNNVCKAIAVDSLNNKWICFPGYLGDDSYGFGIVKFDNFDFTLYNKETTDSVFPTNSFHDITVSRDNIIYACGGWSTITHHDYGTIFINDWEIRELPDIYRFGIGSSICALSNGELWRSTGNAMRILLPGRTSWLTMTAGHTQGPIHEHYNGDVWFSEGVLFEHQLKKWDGTYLHSFDYPVYGFVTAFAADSDSTLWISTKGSGVYHYSYETDSFVNYNSFTTPEMVRDTVLDIKIDHNNIKWLVMKDRIISFDNRNWNILAERHVDLPIGEFFSVEVDLYNNKWFGTSDGLWGYNEDTLVLIPSSINEFPTVPKAITISAYPNPFNSTCRFSGNQNKIEILSNSGKHICYLENNLWQPPQSLESGIYFAREKGKKESIKLIYMK